MCFKIFKERFIHVNQGIFIVFAVVGTYDTMWVTKNLIVPNELWTGLWSLEKESLFLLFLVL